MARTLIRQSYQIRQSDTYDDSLAAGPTLESGAESVQDDLNALRSQVNRLQGGTRWYDALAGRSVEDISTDLALVENKALLYRSQILQDIPVPNGNNFVVLNVTAGEAPSQVAAVGAALTEGAVVAVNGSFGSHTLDEVAGPNAIQPKNLVIVRHATTGDPILSGGKQVYGLIQSENATNGHTFDDVASRVQLSFVRENSTGDDLEAVPVADIEGQDINYSYPLRVFFTNLPEDAYLNGLFLDIIAALGTPDLQEVMDQQGNVAVLSSNETEVSFSSTSYGWEFSSANGSTIFGYTDGFEHTVLNSGRFQVNLDQPSGRFQIFGVPSNVQILTAYDNVGVGQVDIVGDVSITNNSAVNIREGLHVGTANFGSGLQFNSVGVSPYSDFEILAPGDMYLEGISGEIRMTDGQRVGSGWTQARGIALSETSAEWDAYIALHGEVSLLAGITSAGRVKSTAVVTAVTIAPNTDLQNGVNIDAALPAYTNGTQLVERMDVYLNGQLMRAGVDAAADFDVYPGTTPGNGELRFEFALTLGDVITVIRYGAAAA
jgi:hypothetical protein